MKVYISGKIGEEVPSDETRIKFVLACASLFAMGHEYFNPTCSGLGSLAEKLAKQNGTTFYEEILLLDLVELKKCDAVLMLPDWEQSPGALTEYQYAKATRKKFFFAKREHAEEFLRKQWATLPENRRRPASRAAVKEMFQYAKKHVEEAWIGI